MKCGMDIDSSALSQSLMSCVYKGGFKG